MKTIKIFFFLILCTTFKNCSCQDKNSNHSEIIIHSDLNGVNYINRLPAINELRPEIFEQISNKKTMSSGGSFDSSVYVNYEGINYTICWNAENKINYISTNDDNFKSIEGVSINMTLEEVKKIKDLKILKELGWGYYGKLNSDWNIGFCVDESCTGKEINKTDKVKWIFKK